MKTSKHATSTEDSALSLLRKALWPAAIALSLVLFMGLAGKATPARADASDPSDICAIGTTAIEIDRDGPVFVMREETTILVWAQLNDDDNDGHDFTVELDSGSADASITSTLDEGEEVGDYLGAVDQRGQRPRLQ
jgi:hypothetical protein